MKAAINPKTNPNKTRQRSLKNVLRPYAFKGIDKKMSCLLLVIVLLWMWHGCSGQDNNKQNQDRSIPVVRITHPEKRHHSQALSFSGTIKPMKEANLGSSVPGKVEKIYLDEGSFANKGDLIAQLSAEPAIMAQVEKESWENDYNRVKRLKERGSIAPQEYDHVEAQYKAAKAKHQLMQKNTQIRAPFSGTIMEILVREGETFFFMPGTEPGISHAPGVVRLMQNHPVLAEFHFSERYASLIPDAEKITVQNDAFPEEVFTGNIHRIKPMVSSGSRTITAEISIPNSEQKLMVGMYVNINLEFPGQEMLFIPRHALMEEDEQLFVWIVDSSNQAKQKTVNRELFSEGYAAVSGLNKSDQVVIAGMSALEENMEVKIKRP